ncbi:hypothetical protein DMUE_1579 [Dictyocoela muelleri]|nr:hypothetical protein DMUE_1579 [Dictyocoela muelleri]
MIQKMCAQCKICNEEKDLFHNFGITINEFNVTKPREMIGLDIKGPIKASHFRMARNPNKFYILVIVDIFSRYTQIDIITDINSTTICSFFEKTWLNIFEPPVRLISDNGRQFISSNFRE